MGFEEKRRRRAGKFGKVNDFPSRAFQRTAQLSAGVMEGCGNKNDGGKRSREPTGSLRSLFYFMMTSFIKEPDLLSKPLLL